MPIRPAFLIAVSASLCLAIGGEVLAGAGNIGTAGNAMPIAAHPTKPAQAAVTSAALIQPILSRPLFAPSRRPPAVAVAAKPPPPGPMPPPQARLAGTITTSAAHVAFFAPTGGKPVSLEIGGTIAGWQVVSIYPGRVTLRAEDGSLVVKTIAGTTVPIVVSALRNWKPPVFHLEE
ncbi:MAG TPA: hypothetical protein VL574_01325 [Stellaceae bacterium]|jgi:hypothetical protein|nr:hypothetical protein [Stellaceae bacterium]